MKPRSDVWKHYDKFKNELGEKRARCKHCGKDYSGDTANGTSGLSAHLRTCKVYNLAPNQATLSFQTSTDGGVTLQNWTYDKDLCNELYTKMIIIDELPFKFGDNMGFQAFIRGCPIFHISSRFKVARDCFTMYVSRRDGLMSALCEPTQRICLTTNTWTSNQRINYMCLTGHFIDKNWTLHKRILNFCPINSHRGEAIGGGAIEMCLKDWEITRVLSCTMDNASSNDVAMVKLKEKMSTLPTSILGSENIHMRCVAHILNLIVQDGLGVYNESINKVRNVVKYVRHSVQRTTRFEKCVDFENIECRKELILDVPTRWNSTYEMLEVAEKYERAFYRYDEQDLMYKEDLKFKKKGVEGEFDGRPTSDDWIVIRKFASCLKIFYDLTLKVSGTSYVTSNLFFHEIYAVHSILHSWVFDIGGDMYEMGQKMLEKFDKYWGDPIKMNKFLFISVVLDPRHKLQFLVYMLMDMYGGEVGGNGK